MKKWLTTRGIGCAALVGLAAMLSGGGCVTELGPMSPPPPVPGTPPPGTAPQAREVADILRESLPAVVLLIADLPNGQTKYGAGFVVEKGIIVTSLHVVAGGKKIGAMRHKAGRSTYMPADGGLRRFLFENQADMVDAELVFEDATTDLAVVRVGADWSDIRPLRWSTKPVEPGDRVLALGHPQETAWSFSEGRVGALQHGIIQHDAVVGHGSSGGPLLNADGEIVGVSVAKVVNQGDSGLSFARPAAMVQAVFGGNGTPTIVDFSSPEKVALTCWRAQELALPEVADCFDWEHDWLEHRKLVEEARDRALTPAAKARIQAYLDSPSAKEAWILKGRLHAIHIYNSTEKPKEKKEIGPGDPDLPKALLDEIELEKKHQDALMKDEAQGELRKDFFSPEKLLVRLRNGLRVESTHLVQPDLAWVVLVSAGANGKLAKFSELYVRVDGRWVQRMYVTGDDLAKLPKDAPLPMMTLGWMRPFKVARIVKAAATGSSELDPKACIPEPDVMPIVRRAVTPGPAKPTQVGSSAPVGGSPGKALLNP